MLKACALLEDGTIEDKFREDYRNYQLLWLDLEDATDSEIVLLHEYFNFHELAIEDCIFPKNEPKIDDFGEYIFLVIHSLRNQKLQIHKSELSIFVGKNFIVTVHDEPIEVIQVLLNRCYQNPAFFRRGSDFLLHAILDGIVDGYEPALNHIDKLIDEVETLLLTPTKTMMSNIFTIKKSILNLRRIIDPHRAIISSLIRQPPMFLRGQSRMYFKDILDNLTRLRQMTDTYREMTTSFLEVYLASLSTKLNETIKAMSVLATIFLPPMIIFSYYGMNVEFPEQTLGKYALLLVIAITLMLTGGLLLFLKKKHWI